MIPGLEYSIPQVPLYNSTLQLYYAEESFSSSYFATGAW